MDSCLERTRPGKCDVATAGFGKFGLKTLRCPKTSSKVARRERLTKSTELVDVGEVGSAGEVGLK
jgi:hypothetical protein